MEENRKEFKKMKKRVKEEVYNIENLPQFKKDLQKTNRGSRVVYTYNLPLFDFVGSSSIVFSRIACFDGVIKGYTEAGVEKLRELISFVGDGSDESAVMSSEEYSFLEGKFSRKWWKLVNEGNQYNSSGGANLFRGSNIRNFIGAEDVKCTLIDVQADMPSSGFYAKSGDHHNGGEKEENGGDKEKLIFVRPICRWSI
jgi:hypothetical protein